MSFAGVRMLDAGDAEALTALRRASLMQSRNAATSRMPRLKPCAATGCRPCAALPTRTLRVDVIRDALLRVRG